MRAGPFRSIISEEGQDRFDDFSIIPLSKDKETISVMYTEDCRVPVRPDVEGVAKDVCLVRTLAVVFLQLLNETRRDSGSSVGRLSNLGGIGKVLDRGSKTDDDVVKTIETGENVLCCDHYWWRRNWWQWWCLLWSCLLSSQRG